MIVYFAYEGLGAYSLPDSVAFAAVVEADCSVLGANEDCSAAEGAAVCSAAEGVSGCSVCVSLSECLGVIWSGYLMRVW